MVEERVIFFPSTSGISVKFFYSQKKKVQKNTFQLNKMLQILLSKCAKWYIVPIGSTYLDSALFFYVLV